MSDAYQEYEERPGRDVLEYLEIPLRYPRHVLIPFFVLVIAGIVAAQIAPRKYRSATLILVESKTLPESFVTSVNAEGIAARLATIRQVVLSRTRLEQVIKKLDPYPEMAGYPSFNLVQTMRSSIEIKVQGGDSFAIEYVNRDPVKAQMVTNMLATQFTEDAAALRDAMTQKAFGFIQTNLEEAKKAVEEREAALRLHKQKFWGALPEQLDSNLRILGQLQMEQQTLGETLRTHEERRASLERSLLEGKRSWASAGGPGAAAELVKLRAAYEGLRGRYTDDHPEMRLLRARMAQLQKQLAEAPKDEAGQDTSLSDPEAIALSRSLKLVEADIDALTVRRGQLDERITALRARVEATPRAEQELASLTRDYVQLRENYNGALRKEMDAEMARRLEEYWKGGYFRVLDPAHLPRSPIRPYGTLFMIGGLVAGILSGLALAFVADLLDRSIKSERELEELLGSPVLVTIPHAAPPRKRAAIA
ncbi:MAG: GumC family protein [Solirubrobacterales bacterium]|jgi:polysaccharide chain length determinant protein (PEP-CTERM system associated)